MRIMKKYLLLLLAVSFIACTKDEGYGGLASISGKVYALNYNQNQVLLSEGYLGDVRVYISSRGSNDFYDDVRTTYDGSFKFDFLQEGSYDVWVYGDCDYCPWDQLVEKKEVEVTSRKAQVVLEDFVIKI
ncbi:hypothetical protein FLSA109164_06220 [Flavobacterium saliperosum]|uniref:Carboxypeptidase regulatory-like domain-containing protein n=2 Tax=Flavobacterium saliperosum TaxID=329186 RepID=A0A1G4VIP5_9FLAO|nr:hypothetical protein SAMN02927925_01154 [Flavobacterium saliperosum]